MSGILEQILGELQGIKSTLAAIQAAPPVAAAAPVAQPLPNGQAGAATVAAAPPPPAETPPAPADPLLGSPAPSPQVSEAQLMGLIEPYLNDIVAKPKLQAVLQEMGIERLTVARPDQFDELYKRFSVAIEQHKAAQSQAAAPVSIL